MSRTEYLLRHCCLSDIDELAEIYMDIYAITNPTEKWAFDTAKEYIAFFLNQCPELFFVVESNGVLCGGICGQIKPWWSGKKVYNLEIFIKNDFQQQGISKILFRKFFEEAITLYNAVTVEAITFGDREFPLDYYKKIALKKDTQLVLLDGNIIEILNILKSDC